VSFGNAAAAITTASFSVAGTYTLRLTASDSAAATSDDVTVIVNATAQTNRAPWSAPAAINRSQCLLRQISQELPATITATWKYAFVELEQSQRTRLGCIRQFEFSERTATFLAAGSYVLKLSASDGALVSSSNVNITVSAATGRTFYIDYVSGNDSNSGTAKSSPWKHAPDMNTCAATCASVTPTGGDYFVFKGGVTWPSEAVPWD
jgi:hypothetical protein